MGDAAEVNIDKQLFHSRLGNLVAAWKDPKKNEVFGGVGSIVVILGKTEEGPYSKSLSLHVSLSLCTACFPKYRVAKLMLIPSSGCLDMNFLRPFFCLPRRSSTSLRLLRKVCFACLRLSVGSGSRN